MNGLAWTMHYYQWIFEGVTLADKYFYLSRVTWHFQNRQWRTSALEQRSLQFTTLRYYMILYITAFLGWFLERHQGKKITWLNSFHTMPNYSGIRFAKLPFLHQIYCQTQELDFEVINHYCVINMFVFLLVKCLLYSFVDLMVVMMTIELFFYFFRKNFLF